MVEGVKRKNREGIVKCDLQGDLPCQHARTPGEVISFLNVGTAPNGEVLNV